jgi:hypothetical protein
MAASTQRVVGAIPTSATAALTVTAPAKLTGLVACNTGGSSYTVTINVVPAGGAASAANTLISAASVAAGATSNLLSNVGTVYLAAGDQVVWTASNTAVTGFVSVAQLDGNQTPGEMVTI